MGLLSDAGPSQREDACPGGEEQPQHRAGKHKEEARGNNRTKGRMDTDARSVYASHGNLTWQKITFQFQGRQFSRFVLRLCQPCNADFNF